MHNQKQQHDEPNPSQYISLAIDILTANSRLEHFISVLLKKFGLTLPQFNALKVLSLYHPEPLALKKLTEHMIDKSSNTSRLVDKLAEKQLVQREFLPNDRRVLHVSITETGSKLANECMDLLESNLRTKFNQDELNATQKLIDELKRSQKL
ncbi:MAG: MarR family transcriptional regulator [Saprospiraceae bacterium]|nr:MarR family transcriptional regulator [Saprospiraceae bacterium]